MISFNGSNGSKPSALFEGSDGNFYGTTAAGGSTSYGVIYRLTRSGERATLATFPNSNYAYASSVTQGLDNFLYGTTSGERPVDFGTVWRLSPEAATLETIVGPDAEIKPSGSLTRYFDGTFLTVQSYLTDSVLRISPSGDVATIGEFEETFSNPLAGLLLASDGQFYGATAAGGTGSDGSIYRIGVSGGLTVVAEFFDENEILGRSPNGRIIEGADGNFYGTTYEGGVHDAGTVFRMTPNGVLSTVVAFDVSNGAAPAAGLVLAPNGFMYGTTTLGGKSDPFSTGQGTIFQLAPDGTLTTIVRFDTQVGGRPGQLIVGSDGNLYGTTSDGDGTVFRLSIN